MVGSSAVQAAGKRVVVVLGMHRSGTSAATHALEAMGVDLGDRLMPPAPGNNEKGFFEDVEVNAINIDLLETFGEEWDSLAPISAADLKSDLEPLRARARALLLRRLQRSDTYGFKDPRTCKLLPFWQSIFAELGLEDAYVIALRNPLSVANSLEQRDGMAFETSCLLWLAHMLPSVVLTQGRPRVVVDYDRLVEAPAAELQRMAAALGLQQSLQQPAAATFAAEFMEQRLRHAVFRPEDSAADPRIPAPVQALFAVLEEASADRASLEAPGSMAAAQDIVARAGDLAQAFEASGAGPRRSLAISPQGMRRIGELRQQVHDKDVHIANIENGYREQAQLVRERDQQIIALSQQVHDKDVHIGHIENGYREQARLVAERDQQIIALSQQVHDKDVHIANIENGYRELAQQVGERDARIIELAKQVQDRDQHIRGLDAVIEARDAVIEARDAAIAARDVALADMKDKFEAAQAEVGRLGKAAHDKDVHIGNLDVHLANMGETVARLQEQNALLNNRAEKQRASLAWSLAKPARAWWGLAWRLGVPREVDLVPLAQLSRHGQGWQADGPQPQLLLQAERAWHGLAGWHLLQLNAHVPEACTLSLQFDMASGTREILHFAVPAGSQDLELPVYVPEGCRAIRLQPGDKLMQFEIARCSLKRLSTPPEVTAQPGVYERLGGRAGSAAAMAPVSGVAALAGNDAYSWSAENADPHFQLSAGHRLRPGWYMAEVLIHSSIDGGAAKLYFDYGAGYSEENSVMLPYRSGMLVKRLVRVEHVPLQVRFDPIERPARFSVVRLNLAPVWGWFARDRMLRRLQNHVGEFRGQSRSAIRAEMKARARAQGKPLEDVLLAAYGATFASFAGVISYAEWIETVERPSLPSETGVQQLLAAIEPKPLFSVIVPTYNTKPEHLHACLESVCRQTYPHWELCIADDASTQPHVKEILRSYEAKDPRIKVCYRAENGHISRASNSALELASGDFVVLLDHDDELAPHALLVVAEALQRKPAARILYSDEDKLDGAGKRVDPHFKSDWNPDLFYAQNYVSHLGVYRRSLLAAIGGFRAGVEGSQDQDLLLRCLPHLKDGEIVHIPRVLYHWRTAAGSTALDSGEKSYTEDAGLRSLRDYFDNNGAPGVQLESGALPNSYRVRWPVPNPAPLASLIIPTRDRRAITEVAVRSILEKTTYPNFEILIIDNGSVEPETLQFFEDIQREDARVRVLRYDAPFNFSAINNFGERHARGEILGLVNNDVEVINPEWLTEMVSHACRPEIGCVGAKLYYSNDTLQHAGVILGLGGVAGHSHKYAPRHSMGYYGRLQLVQSLSAVTAACLIVRREVYREVGGLDEKNLVVAFNDVDFCLRVRAAGYRNLWTPYAELYHHESISRGTEDTPEKLVRFQSELRYMKETWADQLTEDPYYNPNLTYDREDFSIECRQR